MSVFFRTILGLSLAALVVACTGQPAPEPEVLTETEKALKEIAEGHAKRMANIEKLGRRIRERFFKELEDIKTCQLSDLLDRKKRNSGDVGIVRRFEVELLLRGQCRSRDAAKAAALLEAEIERNPYIENSLARLGGLYWTGDGVPKEKERARKLFRRAALILGPTVIEEPSPRYYRFQQHAEYWSEDPEKYRFAFAARYWPPEPLPAPLQAEVDWLRKLEKGNGEAIFEVANSLLGGKHGFPKDPVLAEKWMTLAALKFKHMPARYPVAMLMREPEYLELLEKYDLSSSRETHRSWANLMLVSSATKDDHRPDELILKLLRKAPDYPHKDRALYFFLLRLDRRGLIKDRSELPIVAARLDEQWRVAIENWNNDSPVHTRLGTAWE